MRYVIVSIFDRAGDVFGIPSFHVSTGSAIRGFQDEVNRPANDNIFYKHPEDFDMYHVGYYDDQTCRVEWFEDRVKLMLGRDATKRGDAGA